VYLVQRERETDRGKGLLSGEGLRGLGKARLEEREERAEGKLLLYLGVIKSPARALGQVQITKQGKHEVKVDI
jgi:predicted component of type VI protein secretion system